MANFSGGNPKQIKSKMGELVNLHHHLHLSCVCVCGHLPNLVVSLGLNPDGGVVALKGCFLFVVARIYSSPLALAQLPGIDADAQGHDMWGNIVILDPPSLEVQAFTDMESVPIELEDTPKRRSAVLSAVKEGRAVLFFYRSGGAVASQLAHHWHGVVRKDARTALAAHRGPPHL